MTGARMWPKKMPKQVREDPQRKAEVKVYDALEAVLGPEWTVYYSRPWLGLTPYGEERDGEADFVVVHPQRGFLVIEVKGGGIFWDPATDVWISQDRNDIRHIIKNPVKQAKTSKHVLLDRAKEMDSWPKGRFIRTAHGVIFPDSPAPPRSLGADMPREMFCCYPDMPKIGDWVRQRLSGDSADDLGTGGVEALEELLARPIALRVPVAHYFDDDEQAIASLTPQQFHVLESFMHLPRIAAGGGAGTGKTIVAMEDAVRLSAQGLRTVLLCVGTKLAAYLKTTLAKTGVEVSSLQELCETVTAKAGMPVSCNGPIPSDAVMDVLAKAISTRPALKYDAIVVDEAQDFRPHWWIVLEELLTDPKNSKLHAFYDTNQSVYGNVAATLSAFHAVETRLTRNLRNTRYIHDAAKRFYTGHTIVADGPQGSVVEWHPCRETAIASNIMTKLRALTGEDEVNPENIAILCVNHSLIDTMAKQTVGFDGISVDHVRDFKGLERQAVLLAATHDMADLPELAYVAMSRPRVYLSVFGEQQMLSWLEGR